MLKVLHLLVFKCQEAQHDRPRVLGAEGFGLADTQRGLTHRGFGLKQPISEAAKDSFPTGQEYLDAYLNPLAAAVRADDNCKGSLKFLKAQSIDGFRLKKSRICLNRFNLTVDQKQWELFRAGGFHLATEVVAVGRGALLKGESIGGGDVQMPENKPLCHWSGDSV